MIYDVTELNVAKIFVLNKSELSARNFKNVTLQLMME